ncbi:ganglioside GM2 activator [Pelomyxa schiedti]|nr:ganglioside GM2 activator [Pelomyxa schiedti]
MPSFVVVLALVAAVLAADPIPFSYSNCGSTSDPIQITALSVSPSPITFGENVTVSGTVKLTKQITAMTLALKLEKQVIGWMNIPCVDNIGSCTYDDVCLILDKIAQNYTCPDLLVENNIPCVCPYPAGTYVLPTTTMGPIPLPPPILDWLTDGNYRVTATMTDPNNGGARLGCYVFMLSLSS